MLNEGLLGLLSDSRDVIKSGGCLSFAALLAVGGDGETVHLILHLCEDFKEVTIELHAYGHWRGAKQEFASAVTVVFDETCYGDV